MAGNIAVVEDEPELQALYRLMLTFKGYDIAYVSANADDAVAMYAQCAKKPDLVIMDRRLNGSSGVEAAARILALHPEARILYATADVDPELFAGPPGIVGVLQKPFSMETMLGAIERALARGKSGVPPRSRSPTSCA